MVKVSVIIPMYNAKSYIRQCLESVLCQTYSNIEILIIDDGSTDQGSEICRERSRIDNRIRILKQERKGVSSARNRGLEEASGKYILFLDSDDAIHPCLLEEYVRQAEKNQTELTFCICLKLNDSEMQSKTRKGAEKALEKDWKIGEKAESGEWFHHKFQEELSRIGGKMVRRDTIGKLRFDEKFFCGEDTIFIHQLILKKLRMAYLDLEWYYYRRHTNSITNLNETDKNRQRFQVYEIVKKREYKRGHIAWALKWDEKIIWMILTDYLTAKSEKVQERCADLKKFMIMEMRHPLYKNYTCGKKILFYTLFLGCSFPPFRFLWKMKQKLFRIR